MQREGLQNVRTVLGTATDPRLPPNLDAVLIVDAYHEMDDPDRPETIRTLLENVGAVAQAAGPPRRRRLSARAAADPDPAPEERVDPETVIAAAELRG